MDVKIADFETINNINDCRVWLWGICDIENKENFKNGCTIESFFDYIGENWLKKQKTRIYFHNLKFDGAFILDYLLKSGYKWIETEKEATEKTFTTLITNMDVVYSIKVFFKKNNVVEFVDSLKLIPKKVEQIAKDFNLPIGKGEIDYNAERNIEYIPSLTEIQYVKTDVQIVAEALRQLFFYDIKKLTISSSALFFYKEQLKENRKVNASKYKKFEYIFPPLKLEDDIRMRPAYKGGYTFLNSEYSDKDINNIKVIDVNSLYPYIMASRLLPIKEGVYFSGNPQEIADFPLWISNFNCEFKLKPNHLPTVQIKHSIYFRGTEYLKDSKGKIVNLTMTSVDFKLFSEHYDIYFLEFNDGYYFQATDQNFKEYVAHWCETKTKSKKDGNGCLYTISKLMQNGLYGKFAFSPIVKNKIPYLEDDKVKFKLSEEREAHPVYLPVAIFVTAWARDYTIRTAQKIYEQKKENGESYYIYSDTDSIHYFDGTDLSEINVDEYELGAWKIEKEAERARYLRQKCYILEKNNEISVTCAGLPAKMHYQVSWENFHPGVVYHGKLMQKRVAGGIVLAETDFTIK